MTLARQLFAFFAFVLGMNVAHTSEPAFKSGGDVLEFGTVASTKADTHLRTVKTESKTVVSARNWFTLSCYEDFESLCNFYFPVIALAGLEGRFAVLGSSASN